MSDVQVFYQATPNPESMKFIVDRTIASENLTFTSQESAGRSPLAVKILGFPWAAGVFIGSNFVTVTKHGWVEWEILADPLSDLIREHIAGGQPVVGAPSGGAAAGAATDEDLPGDSDIVLKIKKILREDIKPAVAMDGGDITFDRFEDGRVYLAMHGSCAGCPSSTMTLKEGIETRLKAVIPEVVEVIAV
jgi:Fe-S cluster biogenesis protein NfuA